MPSKLWLLLALLPLTRLLKSRPRPSREVLIPPHTERVVLLGSSSGVGRDLAHAYARRGARICLVARRQSSLEAVKRECLSLGLEEGKIIVVAADVTSAQDLVNVREAVIQAWGGLDTLHILAGVPSTSTLMDLTGVSFADSTSPTRSRRFDFARNGETYADQLRSGEELSSASAQSESPRAGVPTLSGLEELAAEARACAEVNFVGTVLALGCFIPLLASTSPSPALHHLSSVAATIPAPSRAVYSATKAAAFMAVESCRVECEGSGIRFFTLLPGTIANDFRTKTAVGQSGGRDETRLDIRHAWEKLLLQPEQVVRTILHHLSLPTAPSPLIPYPPFSLFPQLSVPPSVRFFLPSMYRWVTWLGDSPAGWLYIEPSARRKYGLPN